MTRVKKNTQHTVWVPPPFYLKQPPDDSVQDVPLGFPTHANGPDQVLLALRGLSGWWDHFIVKQYQYLHWHRMRFIQRRVYGSSSCRSPWWFWARGWCWPLFWRCGPLCADSPRSRHPAECLREENAPKILCYFSVNQIILLLLGF